MSKSKPKSIKPSKGDKRCDRDELLNHGLSLAMDWGSDWVKSTQERLHQYHPWLHKDQADEICDLVQEVKRFGHHLVYENAEAMANGYANRRKTVIGMQEFEQLVKEKYHWVNEKNISDMYSRGRYIVWKDFSM